jgi:hypothetical protein
MADENIAEFAGENPSEIQPPPSSQENLPLPPGPGNEPPPDNGALPETPNESRIKCATGSLFEKMGFKIGRGRPKKDGTPKISDVPLDTGAMGGRPFVSMPGPSPDLDRRKGLIRRCCKVAFKAVVSAVDKIIFSRAVLASGDKVEAQKIVDSVTATDGEAEAVAEVMDILAEMYGWDPKILVLIAGLTTVSGYTGRCAMCVSELNLAIAKQRVQKPPAPKP